MEFTASFLVEAAVNYEEMFSGVLNFLKAQSASAAEDDKLEWSSRAAFAADAFKKEIAWAEQTLKKNFRIVWWLRWFKLSYLCKVGMDLDTSEDAGIKLAFDKLWEKELAKFKAAAAKSTSPGVEPANADHPPNLSEMRRMHGDLQHCFNNEHIREIQEYPLDYQLPPRAIRNIYGIERDYNELHKDDKNWLQEKPLQTKVIEFPNGWAWWDLETNYDREEADAMGHCGTADTDNTLLSLREPRKFPNGAVVWKPHCTFELDEEGGLRQMKGRNNDKPAAKYHSYILALLENPMVKNIIGGGYKPETNFSPKDLPQADQDALFAKRPELMPLDIYVAKYGMDASVESKLNAVIKEQYPKFRWMGDAKTPRFVTQTWKSLGELVTDQGNETARWAVSICVGDEFLNLDASSNTESMWDALPTITQAKIGRILMKEYPDEVEEWKENEGEEFDPDDDSAVYKFAEATDAEDLLDALRYAESDGYQSGTEKEMWEALQAALTDSCYQSLNEKDAIDGEWGQVVGMDIIMELYNDADGVYIDDLLPNNGVIKCEQPRYGWNEYDDKAALEAFPEHYDVDKKFIAAFGTDGLKAFNAERGIKEPAKGAA